MASYFASDLKYDIWGKCSECEYPRAENNTEKVQEVNIVYVNVITYFVFFWKYSTLINSNSAFGKP